MTDEERALLERAEKLDDRSHSDNQFDPTGELTHCLYDLATALRARIEDGDQALEACRLALPIIGRKGVSSAGTKAYNALRAAIDKARGES